MKGKLFGTYLVLDRVNYMQEHKQSSLTVLNELYTENAYLNVMVPKSRKWRFYLMDKNCRYFKVKWPITVCIHFSVVKESKL